MSELVFESDWLGSEPVYYNEATGAASRNVNDVIAFAQAEFDPEGVRAYLGAGYTVFGRTPVRDVRVLPPSSRLWREDAGGLRVETVPVDLDSRLERRYTEDEVIDLLRARVQAVEAARDGEIAIPTSGGFDSRLLNLMVAEPARVRSFTFGATPRQRDSVEVARARAVAQRRGTRWERIELAPFHGYLDEWDAAFGPAVHAHGMYQMEFYRQVRGRLSGGELLLSGLFGDWFEGKGDDRIPELKGPGDLTRLIFTHGMHADAGACVLRQHGSPCAEEYFEAHRDILRSPRRLVIEAVRIRMMILHYLLRVPRIYGLRSEAPFLDLEVATAMLTLPDDRRRGRQWVTDYLKSRDWLFEDVHGDSVYWLYWPVMRSQPLAPLDEELLAEVMRRDYVRWINRTVSWRGLWYEGYQRLSGRRGFRRAAARLQALGLRQRRLEAYHAYMTLRPLQRVLQKRNAAQEGEA